MTEKLKRQQIERLDDLLRKRREPKYRYTRGLHGAAVGWHKILVATDEIVATRCGHCYDGCPDYFPIPLSLTSD